MTKTTNTTKKNKTVADDQNQAVTEQQAGALPAATLDAEQARKDIATMFALATKAALPKEAAPKAEPKVAAKVARPKAS